MAKKNIEKNDEIFSDISETIATYVQDKEIPKQKMKLKVLAFFLKTNTIAFSYLDENGIECGIELPNINPKFKNLKSGDIISMEI